MKIAQGEAQQFIATAIYNSLPQYKPDVTNDPNTTWTAGNTGVVALNAASKGSATGIVPGKSYIWCQYKGVQSTTAAMLEVGPPKMTITITPNPIFLALPGSRSVHLKITGKYSDPSLPVVDLSNVWSQPNSPLSAQILPFPSPVTIQMGATADFLFLQDTKQDGTATYIAKWTTPYGETASGTAMIYYKGWIGNQCRTNVDFLQIDPIWINDLYANHPLSDSVPLYANPLTDTALPSVNILGGTIGSSGCTMTSMAMGLSTVGAYITPRTLNQEMLKPSQAMIQSTTIKLQSTYYGCNSGNEVDAQALKDFSKGNITSLDKGAVVGDVKLALDNCDIVIVQIPYKDARTDCGHWAIITGYKGDTYHLYDPTFGDRDITPTQFCGKIWVGTVKK